MFEDLQDVLVKTGGSIDKIYNVIDKYQRERKDLYSDISKYQSALDYEMGNIDTTVSRRVQEYGTELLITNAIKAIENTEEFNLPVFIERLIEAIKDDRTISIQPSEYDVDIRVNLDVTAGTLDDYMQGVLAAREILGLGSTRGKIHKGSGKELASKIWAEKIYGSAREGKSVVRKTKKGEKDLTAKYSGKYYLTIETRLGEMKSLAPWWYILEYGTPDVGGPGEAYPQFGGQYFVENSVAELRNYYFDTKATAINEVNDHYRWLIDNLWDQIDSINKLIDELTSYLDKGFFEPDSIESDIDIAVRAIEDHLITIGKEIENADPQRIVELAIQFLEGISIETVGERVSLGGGIRIRTIDLRREFEEAISGR